MPPFRPALKTRLPELLRRVEGGEHIVITKHGRPIARLHPCPSQRGKGRTEDCRELIEFRRGKSLAARPTVDRRLTALRGIAARASDHPAGHRRRPTRRGRGCRRRLAFRFYIPPIIDRCISISRVMRSWCAALNASISAADIWGIRVKSLRRESARAVHCGSAGLPIPCISRSI